jgi:hypothetical protein
MAEGIPTKSAWGKKAATSAEDQSDEPILSFIEIMEEQEHEVRFYLNTFCITI